MPFLLRTWVGPRNHILDGGPDPPWDGAVLRWKWAAAVKHSDSLPWVVKNSWTNHDALWDFDSGMGLRNHVLNGDPDPREGAIFKERGMPRNAQRHSAMSCGKMAEQIKMPFGMQIRVSPGKHVLGSVHTGATWRILLNDPFAATMRPCQITHDHLLWL